MSAFTIIYLHGFNSSPLSSKAQQISHWIATHHPDVRLEIPALKPFPLDAMAQITALADQAPGKLGFIGSSLGGFYASYLAEKFGAPAVLINPAVRPYETLARYLGENENFHTQEKYVLEQQHVDDLRSLYVTQHSQPEKLLLMVQTADETLDFREATAHFHRSPAVIEYGGDHAFQGADRYFALWLDFLRSHAA